MNRIADTVTGVKAAGVTAAGTIASGFASFVGMIPDDIGKAVSLVGGILSIVMIQYWQKNKKKLTLEEKNLELQEKKLELETKILQLQFDLAHKRATKNTEAENARKTK